MFSLIFTWLIIAWGTLACIYMLRCAWTRFPRRDLDDVVHFLHPVDLSLAESLLDPAADFALRWNSTPRAYREATRRRMHLYLELVRRMSHNSRVLIEYGNAIMRRECPTDDLMEAPQEKSAAAAVASELQHAAISVRLYALLVVVRLRLRLWFPLDAIGALPALQLAQLRIAGEVDGPKSYDELKAAAAAAFDRLQPADLPVLVRNM
jgi:hypothetical protein